MYEFSLITNLSAEKILENVDEMLSDLATYFSIDKFAKWSKTRIIHKLSDKLQNKRLKNKGLPLFSTKEV